MPEQQFEEKQCLDVTLSPFWRRIAAWIYDLLGALAIFILALAVGYLVVYLVALVAADTPEELTSNLSQNPFWLLYLLAAVQFFYVWCWIKGGQTLGMRTWRIKLCKPDGSLLSWKEAYLRSFLSFAGLSQLWGLFDKEKRGLQDIYCDTRIVLLPKNQQKPDKPLI